MHSTVTLFMIDTRTEIAHATIEQQDPRVLEVRLRPGTLLSEEVISGVIRSCRSHMACGPCAVLAVVPDAVDFDPHVMSVDLARVNGPAENPVALAIVCEARALECMMDLYFAYFPQPFAVRVFEGLSDAYAWLAGFPLALAVT